MGLVALVLLQTEMLPFILVGVSLMKGLHQRNTIYISTYKVFLNQVQYMHMPAHVTLSCYHSYIMRHQADKGLLQLGVLMQGFAFLFKYQIKK